MEWKACNLRENADFICKQYEIEVPSQKQLGE